MLIVNEGFPLSEEARSLCVSANIMYFNVDEFLAHELSVIYDIPKEKFLTSHRDSSNDVGNYESILFVKGRLNFLVPGTWARKFLREVEKDKMKAAWNRYAAYLLDGALHDDLMHLYWNAKERVILLDKRSPLDSLRETISKL